MKKFCLLLSLLLLLAIGAAFAEGEEEQPLTVRLTISDTVVDYDAWLAIDYDISGGSGNYSFTLQWSAKYIGSESYTLVHRQTGYVSKGRYEPTVPIGGYYVGYITVYDDQNHVATATTPTVTVHDDRPYEALKAAIETDCESGILLAGETVAADFSVVGGTGSYKDVVVRWYINNPAKGNYWSELKKQSIQRSYSPIHGTLEAMPTVECKLKAEIVAYDSIGRMSSYITPEIVVYSPETTVLIFPEDLRRIESGFLQGVPSKKVKLGRNVEYIAPDAFEGSAVEVIYCGNDYTADYAMEHGITAAIY